MTTSKNETESCFLRLGIFYITIIVPANMCCTIVNLFSSGEHERAYFLVGLVAFNVILAYIILAHGKWGWYAIGAEVIGVTLYTLIVQSKDSFNALIWVVSLAIIIGTLWRHSTTQVSQNS